MRNFARMINLFTLLILLSITACSSFKKTSVFEIADKTKHSVVKKIDVANEDEAKKVLQGRHNYLKLLFEQSRDPYYGHPKWTETCLQGNKIGPVTNMTSLSELYVDNKGNPGFCPENPFALRAFEVDFYCAGEQSVYQITIPQNAPFDLNKVSLCK